MRATRAYIASAGTAAVMLGASLCLLAVVVTFVAFGRWPGAQSGSAADQLVLRSVATTPHAPGPAVRAQPAATPLRAGPCGEARDRPARVRRGGPHAAAV